MLNLGSSNRLSGGTDANGRSHTQLHLPQIDVVASLIQAVSPQSSPRKLRRDLSTASITSVQSAATVMGGHQSSWKDLHISPDRTMKHSYSVPADAVHQPMTASSSTASLVSPRRSPHRYTVSTRLYTDPYTAARLQNDSSAIVPFVPRPLTPLAKQSPLVSQWMALLAWETGNSPANVSKGIRFQRMLEALEKECIRHVAELTAEAQRDAIRRTEAQQAQKVRLIRRAELAAATLAAERSFRRQALARFGGVLAIPEADFDILPPTLEIPIQHTALICDMLEKCAGDCGRMAPLIRRIVRQLFSCTYQGVDSTYDDEKHHEEERKKFAAAAGGHASAGASISPASALPACSLSIVPYFHVAHLLNLEYHRGQSLIHRYVDTQQTMHIQGLKRSDILNGAVRRMQATLEYHVFQRWKHVVRVRQAQLKAHLNLTRRYQTSAAHMKSHFLSWLSAAQLSRRAKDDHRLREHASGMAELQLQHKHSKRDHSIVQESKKEGKEKEVGLTRETEDARRQLHFLSVQSAALESVSIHRLLDSAFELLKQGLEGLVNELEIARTLQLQDPLRILHPLRSTWEWSEVYQECDVGSIGWAGLRREEREAARAFFEGRMGGYESGLAHTQAEDEGAAQASKSAADPPSTNSPNTTKRTAKHHSTSSRSSLPATSSSPSLSSVRSSASLASHSIQPYNYTQEVELVLLWFKSVS
jgi:hypothetical protein